VTRNGSDGHMGISVNLLMIIYAWAMCNSLGNPIQKINKACIKAPRLYLFAGK